jgi:hypothetical protein
MFQAKDESTALLAPILKFLQVLFFVGHEFSEQLEDVDCLNGRAIRNRQMFAKQKWGGEALTLGDVELY